MLRKDMYLLILILYDFVLLSLIQQFHQVDSYKT